MKKVLLYAAPFLFCKANTGARVQPRKKRDIKPFLGIGQAAKHAPEVNAATKEGGLAAQEKL